MADKIDHAAEARRLQDVARGIISDQPTAFAPHMGAVIMLDEARLEAQLALAEGQRIANLIAYVQLLESQYAEAAKHSDEFDHDTRADSIERHGIALDRIREGLGALMAGETIITVVGNLTADPELRFTQNGLPVTNFTIASTPRTFDKAANEYKDGDALFMRCSAWREFAEHIAGSLTKGMRVVAQGRLRQRSYQDREGNQRTAIELEVDEIGPSLRYATAQVTRAARTDGQQRPSVSAPAQTEQWATSEPPTEGGWNDGDETPF